MNSNAIALLSALSIAAMIQARSQPVVQFAPVAYTVAESAGSVSVGVLRTGDTSLAVTVDFATTDYTAIHGINYNALSGTLNFEAGDTLKPIVVPILDEGSAGTRLFHILLSNPAGGAVLGTSTNASVVILADHDSGFQLKYPSFSVAEDAAALVVDVVRDDDRITPTTVDFFTSDVTARSGSDYTGLTNTLSFGPQERVKQVVIPILNNTVKQGNRVFRVSLSNPSGALLGRVTTALVTIVDNDQGLQFGSSSYSVSQEAGVVRLSVLRGSDDTNGAVTVDFATADLTATNEIDYVGLTNTLAFAPGETLKRVLIPLLNNGVRGPTKSFQVTLSNPTGGAVLGAPASASIAILNANPGVGFEARNYTNSWGATSIALTILRGNSGLLGPISVDYATSDASARAGVDYQHTSGTLEFQLNETVKTLTIPLLQARAPAGSKSFRVILSNPSGGAVLGATTAAAYIVGCFTTVAAPFSTSLALHGEDGTGVVTWEGGGTLQRSDSPAGPWQSLTNAKSPYAVKSPIPSSYYRVSRPRPVEVYVPSTYAGTNPLPLVILLHGYGWSGADMENWMHLQPLAESRGFLYCHPDSETDPNGGEFWNGTDACCDLYGVGNDDAGFLRALIEQVGQRFVPDRKRIYLVGHSNGGYLSYHTACESSDVIAAIVSLAGSTFMDPGRCQPAQPVNILQIHGTFDEWQFYAGGANVIGGGADSTVWKANLPPFPSAPQSIQTWAGYNGASAPVTDPAPTLDLTSDVAGLDTVVTRYTNVQPGGAVELWTIVGGTHFPNFSSQFSTLVINWLFAHQKP